MSIGLVDTSILCEILPVPGKSQRHEQVIDTLESYIQREITLLLPMATILETGNHIAHINNGDLRRATAERFVALVQEALDPEGAAPWTVSQPLLDLDDLQLYLDDFPEYAMRGVGLGDHSIIEEYKQQCELYQAERVFIWSLDGHLSAYDRKVK